MYDQGLKHFDFVSGLFVSFKQLFLFVQKQCKRRYGPQVVTAKIELKPPPYMLVRFEIPFWYNFVVKISECSDFTLQMYCFKICFQRFFFSWDRSYSCLKFIFRAVTTKILVFLSVL